MRAKPRSLVSALLLLGLTATGLLVFGPSPTAAETSYHKLKKHLRTAEHNTGFLLGQIFVDGDPASNLEIDLLSVDSEVGRSEHPQHKAAAAKPASPSVPSHKEPAKTEPAKPAHPAK